jgi:hypothetical protein
MHLAVLLIRILVTVQIRTTNAYVLNYTLSALILCQQAPAQVLRFVQDDNVENSSAHRHL